MPKTKAAVQRQQKPPPAATEKRAPERRGKAAGPQRAMLPISGGAMATSMLGPTPAGAPAKPSLLRNVDTTRR